VVALGSFFRSSKSAWLELHKGESFFFGRKKIESRHPPSVDTSRRDDDHHHHHDDDRDGRGLVRRPKLPHLLPRRLYRLP
jgi:hypothetical protein